MSASTPREPQRIAKLLARAGIASRREIERMIAEGRIAIDGKPVDTPATVLPSLRGVTVDGKPVQAPAPARLFAFHKPTGLLVTERDPKGRPTIYDRLPRDLPRVVPVGRLDLNTEGLLLLTTDGELKRQLELPATGVERTYRARTYGPVTQAQLEELIEGVEIEGVRYGAIDANLERRTGTNAWIELTLKEGKNREVRRVLEHLGLKVSRLIRTRYGPFVLGDMAPGEIGEIRQHDLVAFRKNPTRADAAVHAARAQPKQSYASGEEAPVAGDVSPKPDRSRTGPTPTPPPKGRSLKKGAPRKPRDESAPAKPGRAARARVWRASRPSEAGAEGRPAPAAKPVRGRRSDKPEAPRERPENVRGRSEAPRGRSGEQRGKTDAPRSRSDVPRSDAPKGRPDTPRGRPGTPQGRPSGRPPRKGPAPSGRSSPRGSKS